MTHTDPAPFEFLWGPRAHAEASEIRAQQYLAKFSSTGPRFHPSVNTKAVRVEEESIQEANAVRPLAAGLAGLSQGQGPDQ